MLVTVVGSVNLDTIVNVDVLPQNGETVGSATITSSPGGKGANQALAARRLGAQVRLIAAVGDDPIADEALSLLADEGVDLSYVRRCRERPTGQAIVTVDRTGATTIAVSPGANYLLRRKDIHLEDSDLVLVQNEVSEEAVEACIAAPHWLCINPAPPRQLSLVLIERADLIVVNRLEHAALPLVAAARRLAVTAGENGATLGDRDQPAISCPAPPVHAIDGTGAGDAFVASLALDLVGGLGYELALRRACAAGGLAASKAGGQLSAPFRVDVDQFVRDWNSTTSIVTG